MANGPNKSKSEKIRFPGSPPPADSLYLSMPNWSVAIKKMHDLKYWQIKY